MPRNLSFVTPLAKVALVTAMAGTVLLVAAVRSAPAQAATPCWKQLLNDWYDGRIDQTYAVHCYRDALKHLPADVQTYSSAHDDILRALQTAIAKTKKQNKPVGNNTLVPPEGSGGSGSGSGGSGSGSGGSGGGSATTTTTSSSGTGSQGRGGGGGLAGTVDSGSPSSVPVPLLILGGLALLLVAAGGAGLLAKRLQARRLRP
jgi:hypothetical protein